MEGSRVSQAVARLETALARMESAAAKLGQSGKQAGALANRNARLEQAIRKGMDQIDALIEELER